MDKFLRKISTLLVYLFLICNSILVLGPVIWTIMASFKKGITYLVQHLVASSLHLTTT